MTTRQVELLSYAVRPRVILKQIGTLLLALAALTLVPATVSILLGEMDAAWRYGGVIVAAAVSGAGMSRISASTRIRGNEALVIVAGIFLIAPLAMSLPIMASDLRWIDSLFEAISAATTTGLSVAGPAQMETDAFLFGRAWMQWYGGLGIVVLSLALALGSGPMRRRLADAQGLDDEGALTGIRRYARRALIAYLALSAMVLIGLLLCGENLFNAAAFTMASVSTGGFAPAQESLISLSSAPAMWIVSLGALAGSVSFAFYVRLSRGGSQGLWKRDQVWPILTASLIATLALSLCLMFGSNMAWSEAAHHAPLMAMSAQTTAGFSTIEIATLDAPIKLILIISMAIGGESGSTAGGFKLIRLLIVLRLIHAMIAASAMPRHAVQVSRLHGRRLGDAEARDALTLIVLYVGVIAVSWLAFLAMGYDPMNSLFEVVSAIGTVGLSSGVCGPELPTALKLVLCANMLLGRLEIVAWLVLIRPRTWMGKRGDQ